MLDTLLAAFQATPTNEIVGLLIVGILMTMLSLSASKTLSETTNGVTIELTIENKTPGRLIKLFWFVLAFVIPVWYVVGTQIIMMYFIVTSVAKEPFNSWLTGFQPSTEEVQKGLDKLKGATLSDIARR